MTGSRPGRPSSSCCSSNRTVIEADQQLNQLDHTPSIEDDVILNPSSRPRRAGRSSSSSSNRSSARNHDSVDRTGGGGGGGGTYRSDDDDDDDRSRSEHERRLRLIDANRTMSRLVNDADEDEDHDLESHGHQPYHHPRASTVDETRTIRTEILLSSMNQRTGFELDRQLTILQLKHHLLQHWPSDWNQKQEIPKVNHVNQLRMVYMGRFLDEDDTLNSLGVIRPVIIHLAIKPDEGLTKEGLEHHDLRASLWSCCGLGRARRPPARAQVPHPPPTTTNNPSSNQNRSICSRLHDPNHRGCLIS